MMRQYELVERVLSYDPQANEDLLNKAYVYAMQAHGHQKRASGDPFFSHPLEVAAILTDLKLDDATIATALLHDTIEDTDATRAEIDEKFGPEIGALVDGLTKIKKLDLVTREAKQAENFRKLLIAITSDIRVLLVKLADRLHNMRTIEHMKESSRQRIAKETMEIYAPLAGRMGMQWLREELEDLSFRWLQPESYKNLAERLDEMRARNKEFIETISAELTRHLKDAGIEAKVSGREKKPYSIWRKIERKQVAFEQLSDIFGFRVVVNQRPDCYQALGVIHTIWRVVPGRFKDYISNPKQNDYQSLHTTIVGPGHQRVELQIRTMQMHHIAEYGVAAHTLYKDETKMNGVDEDVSRQAIHRTQESNAYRWLRQLVDMLLEGDNSEEFLEHTKLELFRDQVFCFTPKGALVALPSGAVPIDFAYAVHTDVGNSCIGCKVNGSHVPLVSELQNGDEVEIITSKAQTPPPAWEAIAVTGKARSAIRRATREAIRRQYGELGRQILRRVLLEIDENYSEEMLEKALPRLIQNSVIEVLSAVGRGELSSEDVIAALYPDVAKPTSPKRRRVQRKEEGWFSFKKAIGLKFRNMDAPEGAANGVDSGVPIRGQQSDLPVQFASGGAVPGDRIVGILTSGEGITIYPIHSMKLAEFENQPERWVDVTWDIDENNNERFPAQIDVTGLNEPGTLARITQIIGDFAGNILNLKIETNVPDFSKMLIDVEVWDIKHLNDIINGLKQVDVVSQAGRHYQ
ncbi:MAG: RelA/SpoT family protein [Methyloligellaceae bacterium]